jgi:hypothetical protein
MKEEEVRCSSEVIRISSPPTTMCCSIRGTVVEALHDPTAEACIMSEFLADMFIGSMPLVLTDKLFKSPSGLIFECRGIARAVPIEIDKIMVQLDFHIYPILGFDLLIGSPLEKLLQENSSQGSLNNELGKTAFTIPISCLEIPMVKHHLDLDPLKEVKFISPFISPRPTFYPCETECPSSPSLEFNPYPFSYQNVVLDSDRESSSILHDASFCDLDIPTVSTLEPDKKHSANEHESFSFEFPQESCLHKVPPESISPRTTCSHKDHNHPSALSRKMVRRMVVDTFVYHEHCKFHECTVALTLQLKH